MTKEDFEVSKYGLNHYWKGRGSYDESMDADEL